MRKWIALNLVWCVTLFGCAQSAQHKSIEPVNTTVTTASKPQSKVWKYKDHFYSIFPDHSGTNIWKLMGSRWNKHFHISENKRSQADCCVISDTVFILLFQGIHSEFTAVKFDEVAQQYDFLTRTQVFTPIVFDESTETATMAVDSESTLWMTYETSRSIEVRSARSPYTTWSSPMRIAGGVEDDDISAVVRMSKAIGVLWSNQRDERFGFKMHQDGDLLSMWSPDEIPASRSALDVGKGMADDHINLKYTAEGVLYAAIKTSYDLPSQTKIGLLVRRPTGQWDSLYHVSYHGTRPIVTVDTSCQIIKVFYTHTESGGDIVYKESPLGNIHFGPEITMMDGSKCNNTSSTKYPHDGHNIVIASDGRQLFGKITECQDH